jgi:hypothetical protein
MKFGTEGARRWARLLFLTCLSSGVAVVSASDRATMRAGDGSIPAAIANLKLDAPLQMQGVGKALQSGPMDPSLVGATGRQQVVVRLKSASTGEMADRRPRSQRNNRDKLAQEQEAFVSRALAADPSARVLGRTQHVLNAVFLDVSADSLQIIARDLDVARIAPVGHYRLSLTETVPYVGAAEVQARGFDGEGIRVAVLDSGVDYTHANLGGSGDPADYLANDGTIIEPGTFPTAKVVDGFDFLGNVWPTGPGGFDDPPMPDPDPLDDLAFEPGAFAGHGTHVADIIGGENGVAPGADIYAVKVCASLTPSCNGISLILGMEWATDPDGDGDTADRVDIINLSLGADYGQPFDDDLSAAVESATALGILTVSSAGNCADQPYCTGTPSNTPSALSVAQTQVPSAELPFITVNGVDYESVFQAWSVPPAGVVSGPLQYGDGAGGNLLGCDPFAPGSLTGLVVLVDRGACNFTRKASNISQAGAVAAIIGLVDGSAPFSGGDGGDRPIDIPAYMISLADANAFRDQLGSDAVIDPANGLPLVGTTVSSTARGPDMSYNAIKPEIGAPGASVSAEVGTGTGETPFGGTSGAGPMVAGGAALLQDACRARSDDDDDNSDDDSSRDDMRESDCSPLELKALLMNNAYRDVISDTTFDLAEITRIGGGELRVDDSLDASFIAWSTDDGQPSLSLGFMDVDSPVKIRRTVAIENTSNSGITVDVTPTFRFADDAANGAVSVSANRSSLKVPAGKTRTVKLDFSIDPSLLPGNFMNSGSQGNNPAALSANEYDGYLLLNASNGDEAALPWHILPRQAASVAAGRKIIFPGGFPDSLGLVNNGAGIAQNDAYSLIALSDEMPRGEQGQQSPMPDLRAVGVTTIPAQGFCAAEFLWAFAINTWDRQSHLVPVSHQVILDIDQDGTDDYVLLNRDVTFNNVTDGRQLSWVLDLNTGGASAFFFAEHATNTNNTVLLACGEQLGLTSADILATNVNVSVVAQDFYYGGPGDQVGGITITPLGEQYFGVPSGDLEPGGAGALDVFDFGPFPGNTPELGVMLYTNGDRGSGAHGGATEDTEALLFLLRRGGSGK